MSQSKKPKLADLARARVDGPEAAQELLDELQNQTDRGAALIGAAYVDMSLIRALKCNLAALPAEHASWFENEGGPLASFSRRIKMARALGLVGADVEQWLNIIRKVRNQFAHAVVRLDFENELIVKECAGLPRRDFGKWYPDHSEGRRVYCVSCIDLSCTVDMVADQTKGRPLMVWTP